MLRTLLAVALLAVTACSQEPAPVSKFQRCAPQGLLDEGDPIPDCRFEGLPGHEDLDLAALRGTPTVINFWAEWCPNCVKEMPAFQRVAASLEGKVRFVGMDMLGVQGETRQAAIAFAERIGVRYQLAFDPGGLLYGHFARRSERPILPVTVFVDAQGILRDRRFGELNEKELREHIRTSLGVS